MSEEARPAKLAPIDQSEVLEMVSALTADTSLRDATGRLFWLLGEPLNRWGVIKVSTELEWWLSGGAEGGGADYTLRLNWSLWTVLHGPGRRFVLDHFLSQVKAKEGGQTTMETDEGERQLFEKVRTSLGLDPDVVARNPDGIKEIKEVYALHRALTDPAQYTLDLEAAAAEPQEEDEEEKPPAEERVVAPPVFYYERRMLGDLGPVALRYDAADRRLASLTGVHFAADAAALDGLDLAALTYQDRKPALSKVRAVLEAERAEWEARDIKHANSLDEHAEVATLAAN